MILGKDDIKAIADEVMRRLLPILAPKKAESPPSLSEPEWRAQYELKVMALRKQHAEGEEIDIKIRELSQKMPMDLRPLPEQYRSHDRKLLVLELVEDPSRWSVIATLKKQWPNRKRTAWEDGVGPRPSEIPSVQQGRLRALSDD